MTKVYYFDWERENYLGLQGRKAMMEDFEISESDLVGCHILFAQYQYADYNGEAFVLFEKDDKLYEVNGNHCSCFGLEGQWSPEETSIASLLYRLDNGQLGKDSYYDSNFDEPLRRLVLKLEAKGQ